MKTKIEEHESALGYDGTHVENRQGPRDGKTKCRCGWTSTHIPRPWLGGDEQFAVHLLEEAEKVRDEHARRESFTKDAQRHGLIQFYAKETSHEPYRDVTIREETSEGYGTGRYIITGLTREHLQFTADWLLGLPEPLYGPLKHLHRSLERYLMPERRRR